jgi:hypothetical protein
MRDLFMLGLTFVAAAGSARADAPIPQDAAAMEKRSRDWLEWNRRTLAGAYDKVGRKDPRWDKPAREALELTARMFSMQVDPVVTLDDIDKPAKAAIDAGCDDPMVSYVFARSSAVQQGVSPEEARLLLRAAASALAGSGYPPYRRAAGLYLAGLSDASSGRPAIAQRDFAAVLDLLPESVEKDEHTAFWEERWFDALMELIRGYRMLGREPQAAHAKVDAALEKIPELKALRLKVRGVFLVNLGWEVRTTRFADQVGRERLEKFAGYLEEARKAFEESWELRPGDAKVASNLLDIDKAIGGDRATMERWFERAMKADGNNYAACLTKLDCLDPKWHGTDEEMIAFGRACRATGNWRTGIILLGTEGHYRYAYGLEPDERSKYLGSPEIWPEIKSVYDRYLEHYPHESVVRSKYAALAYLAGRHAEAHAQFQALGDRLATWALFPLIPLDTLKQMRDESARLAGK